MFSVISGLRDIATQTRTRLAPASARVNAPLVATVVLSLLLAVQAGRLVWLFVEPAPEEEEVTVDAPVVIAETRVDVPEATVSDAVMMLDLRNTNALLFKNAGTGRHNMVYRRGDGSIGWVEPS